MLSANWQPFCLTLLIPLASNRDGSSILILQEDYVNANPM